MWIRLPNPLGTLYYLNYLCTCEHMQGVCQYFNTKERPILVFLVLVGSTSYIYYILYCTYEHTCVYYLILQWAIKFWAPLPGIRILGASGFCYFSHYYFFSFNFLYFVIASLDLFLPFFGVGIIAWLEVILLVSLKKTTTLSYVLEEVKKSFHKGNKINLVENRNWRVWKYDRIKWAIENKSNYVWPLLTSIVSSIKRLTMAINNFKLKPTTC